MIVNHKAPSGCPKRRYVRVKRAQRENESGRMLDPIIERGRFDASLDGAATGIGHD